MTTTTIPATAEFPPNPLLDEAMAEDVGVVPAGTTLSFEEMLDLPRKYLDGEGRNVRMRLVHTYSWAIPCPEALNTLASYAPLVEMGAGTGYWAWLLRQMHIPIVAIDKAVRVRSNTNVSGWHENSQLWTAVIGGTPSDLAQYTNRTLFLCWPPHRSSFADRCLDHYRGRYLLFIGEHDGGCTGSDRFWSMIENDWVCVDTVDIPQWPTIHDDLQIYERRPS
jgi:hypothetical protein